MVREIRLHVEGGGKGTAERAARQGLSQFFKREIGTQAGFQIIVGGARSETFKGFRNILRDFPNAINLLLIDSEGPVDTTSGSWGQLKRSNRHWDCEGLDDQLCHFMVQAMEAWLVADPDALETVYGSNLNRNALPGQTNVEAIPKRTLVPALKSATPHTPKGAYQKKHAFDILALVDPQKVRRASIHCDRLFRLLAELMAPG